MKDDRIRVLILEDRVADADLFVRELRRAGLDPNWTVVEDEPSFLAALEADPEVVLADYALPQFDGLRALTLMRDRGLETPFILISGVLGEEAVVAAMKRGATDYLVKSRLDGLGSAVLRALEEKRMRDDRCRALASLHSAELRLKFATEASNVGPWEWNLVTDEVYFSPVWKRQIGYTDEELPNRRTEWDRRLHPEDRGRILEAVANFRAQPEVGYNVQFRLQHKNGSYRWIQTRAMLVPDHSGRPISMLGCHLDVTEIKDAEQRLRYLNRTYAVLSAINQLIVREQVPGEVLQGACRIAVATGGFRVAWIGWWDDASGRLKVAARAGIPPVAARLWEEFFADPQANCDHTLRAFSVGKMAVCNQLPGRESVSLADQAAVAAGCEAMISIPLTVAGRRMGVFNLYSERVNCFDQEELRLLKELTDDIAFALESCARLEEKQRSLEDLRQSEERFRELAESIQEVFWVVDPATGRILYVSPAYEKIWGRSRDGLVRHPESWLESVYAEDGERVRMAAQQRPRSQAYDETYRICRPDGSVRWIRERAYPVFRGQPTVQRIVRTAEDITDRKHLEEQYNQSQKMEAIGRLAGGIAHDFNNLLGVILMQGDIAAGVEGLPEAALECLESIVASAERAAALTRQLLAFSHRHVLQPRLLDLNEIVVNLAKMLKRVLGEDIQMEIDLDPEPVRTRADSGMLDQVLLNLVVNARDAMIDGGRLTISTRNCLVTPEEVRHLPEAVSGPQVRLGVADTGCGMAPELLPRIFEPFFTTKPVGKGTGLGLSTVFGIVKQHRGWIRVVSEPGQGSRFEIHLPREDGPVDPRPAATESRATLRGSEVILLVEDDQVLRRTTRTLLERSGYRLLEAGNGVEALALWEVHRDAIHLVLTDLVMPGGVGGRELATRLQRSRPGVRILFTSGYDPETAGHEFNLKEGENFLTKPCSSTHLLQTIRRCLSTS